MARSAGKNAWVHKLFTESVTHYEAMQRVLTAGFDVRARKKAARLFSCSEGDAFLDLCTGTGQFAAVIQKLYPGVKLTAVDFCEAMLETARKSLSGHQGPHVAHFVQGNVEDLPFSDSTFYHAGIAFGLRHTSDAVAVLGEAYRVLKRGGRIVLLETTNCQDNWWPRKTFSMFYRQYFFPFYCKYVLKLKCPYIYLADSTFNFPSRLRLHNVMEAVGFKGVTWSSVGFGQMMIGTGEKK